MGFKIVNSDNYRYLVQFGFRNEQGVVEKKSFTAVFARLGRQEVDALTKQPDLDDQTVVDAVLVGWDGVEDEQGHPAEFNAAMRAALFNIVGVRAAVVRAWFASLSTEVAEVAAEGN